MAVLERESIDVLFTDVAMPGDSDGFALARKDLKRWLNLRALLALDFLEAKLNLLQKNGRHIRLLNKPYRKKELAAALADMLAGNGRNGRR
jgi:CheY-like chemotaxis protein